MADISERQASALKEIETQIGKPILAWIAGKAEKRTQELDESGIDSKQAVMKTEGGEQYPARCYAYVPDNEKVDTWKLRMCGVGTTDITRDQLGAAAAAFSPGGHRGDKVQLPQEDVAKVKRKLVAEYRKLDVEKEDMPESIKGLEILLRLVREVDVEEKLNELAEKVKSVSGELKAKMEGLIANMQKAEEESVIGTLRQLMELIAEVDNVELRGQLEALVTSMQDASEVESDMEESMEEEGKECKPDADVKEFAQKVYDELELDKLSGYLEAQKEYSEKANGDIAAAIQELAAKVKAIFDKQEEIEQEIKQLKATDEKKVAEKLVRNVPAWSGFNAARAAETELTEDEAKQFARPEVPTAISALANSMMGGKR